MERDAPSAVIVEVESEGHRLHYVGHLWAAADPDTSELVLGARAGGADVLQAHPRLAAARPVVLGEDATPADVLRAAFERAAAAERVLVVPDGDRHLLGLLRLLLRRPTTRVAFVLMRPSALVGPWAGSTAPTLAKILAVQLLRLLPRVRPHFLTDGFGVVRRRRGYPGVRPVRDPVAAAPGAGETRPAWVPERSPETFLVGVFGVVGRRKNLHLLLDALDEVPEMVLVVGGRIEPEVAALLDRPGAVRHRGTGRLVVHDGLLSADEFGGALAAVDVTAVLHDNDSPSGILAEGCLRGTPALVTAGGWLDRIARATGIGEPVARDARSVADGIRRMRGSIDELRAATRRAAGRLEQNDFADRLLGGTSPVGTRVRSTKGVLRR